MPTKVRLTMRGTRPLLMHNVQAASPLNAFSQQMAPLKDKRNKTLEDHEALARLDWEAGLYHDASMGPFIPVENVFMALVEGARPTRAGMKIERGLNIEEALGFPLLYKGPRDIETMWKQRDKWAYCRLVGIGTGKAKKKIDRWRPRFTTWTVESELTLDGREIGVEEFTRIAEYAGSMIGLCDYRRFYGRFQTTVEEI